MTDEECLACPNDALTILKPDQYLSEDEEDEAILKANRRQFERYWNFEQDPGRSDHIEEPTQTDEQPFEPVDASTGGGQTEEPPKPETDKQSSEHANTHTSGSQSPWGFGGPMPDNVEW